MEQLAIEYTSPALPTLTSVFCEPACLVLKLVIPVTLRLKLKREQDCGELIAHHFSDIQVNIVTKKLAYMFNLAVM